jgi:hypothetical protein
MSKARLKGERRHSERDWDAGGPPKPSFQHGHEAVFWTVIFEAGVFWTVIGEAGTTPDRPNEPEEVDGC